MSLRALSLLLILASSVLAESPVQVAAAAAASTTPLVDRRFTYPNIPYQVDPTDPPNPDGTPGRGPQQGYSICNSTTQNQQSLCQTSFVNSLDDFCVWGPSKPNSLIQDTEGETIAWCSSPKHGTRTMPAGTITGAQFLKAPGYVQVTGTINQVNIDMAKDDDGGELDPHGADARGNPLGGLIYSNAFPSNGGNNNSYQQVIEWHNFMGTSQFCIKACDPSVANSKQYCQNIYDRIGCAYNAPASYTTGEYTVCDSENQDPPGVYTDASGAKQTYRQPLEGVPIETLTWTAKIPKTSNCVTYASSDLFAAAASITATSSGAPTGTASVTGSSSSPSGTGSKSSSGTPSSSPSSSGSKASGSSTASSTSTSKPNAARSNVIGASGLSAFVALAVCAIAGLGAVIVAL